LSPLDVRQLDERDDQADRQIYLNALLGARTIDGDNNDNNNNNDADDSDAGERETISFFDQSVFFLLCFIDFPLKELLLIRGFESSLLREEGQTDVFLNRRLSFEDEDSESDEEGDPDDDDDDDEDLLYLT
jgi:hypothetical protein